MYFVDKGNDREPGSEDQHLNSEYGEKGSDGKQSDEDNGEMGPEDPGSDGEHSDDDDGEMGPEDPGSDGEHSDDDDGEMGREDPGSDGEHSDEDNGEMGPEEPGSDGEHSDEDNGEMGREDPGSNGEHPGSVPGIGSFGSPLYAGAPISTDASWCAIMQYAVSNKLTYKATTDLLDLMKIHCPSPNNLPTSFYKLKKHFSTLNSGCTYYNFCASCLEEVPGKKCSSRQCQRMNAEICSLVLLPFDHCLREIFHGKCTILSIPISDTSKLPALRRGCMYAPCISRFNTVWAVPGFFYLAWQ